MHLFHLLAAGENIFCLLPVMPGRERKAVFIVAEGFRVRGALGGSSSRNILNETRQRITGHARVRAPVTTFYFLSYLSICQPVSVTVSVFLSVFNLGNLPLNLPPHTYMSIYNFDHFPCGRNSEAGLSYLRFYLAPAAKIAPLTL